MQLITYPELVGVTEFGPKYEIAYFCSKTNNHVILMSKRSPIGVFLFSLFLYFFYPIFWLVQTKKEMTDLRCDIPTSWLIIVPFANFYWEWKYSEGAESVTYGKLPSWLCFLLLQFKLITALILVFTLFTKYGLGFDQTLVRDLALAANAIALAIIQAIFNRVSKETDDDGSAEKLTSDSSIRK